MTAWPKGKVSIATDALCKYIKGKKVALMMNVSSTDNDGGFVMDNIIKDGGAKVEFFISMEHGVRGNFQGCYSDSADVDAKTGIEIKSLYKMPLQDMGDDIKELDAVVFSAQDIGLRHWTFTAMMYKLISFCAELGTEVIVLDRPNPLRGDIVEGEIAKKYLAYHNVCSYNDFRYPLRHGMTIGELAIMYNETRNVGAKLTVFKMEGYTRDMWFEDTGLLWMAPTPNMVTAFNALNYGTTGLLQGANVALGRRTTTPYQYVGADYFNGEELAAELNSRDLPGIFFMQKYCEAAIGGPGYVDEMVSCDGVELCIFDKEVYSPVYTQLHLIDAIVKLYGGKFDLERSELGRYRMCCDEVCDAAKNGESLLPIIPEWKKSSEEFMKIREKYLLY